MSNKNFIFSLVCACTLSSLIFWALYTIAHEEKEKRVQKQEQIDANYANHDPDPNF